MGTKLVRRKGLTLILALIAFAGCKAEVKKPPVAVTVPQVRATVITIETKLQPDNKTFTHTIVIANNKARSLDELDHWRLFDLKANTITFVDDIAHSFRTVPAGRPALSIDATKETRPLQGINTALWTTHTGGYTRQLWIGKHPAIPPQLFSMMSGVEAEGFPLAEHAELAYLNKKLVVDKTVTRIDSKDVPASLFEISRAYTRR